MIMQNADGSVTLRTDQDIDDYFNIWLTWYKRWWYKLVNGYWKCWFGFHLYAPRTSHNHWVAIIIDLECERCGHS